MKFFFLFLWLWTLLGCTSSPVKKRVYTPLYLNPSDLKDLDFHQEALVLALIDGVWYYVRADGKAMRPILEEDGTPDHFEEGLARTRIDGKIGFFNKDLDLVLPPQYEFAFPFHNGMADVCIGCKEVMEQGVTLLDGGKWKRINRQGLLVEE